MENKIREAFGSIVAEQKLIDDTYCNVLAGTKAERRISRRTVRRFAFAAASVAMVLFVVVGINLYASETAYISIDVNPSISLSVNRYGKVIEAVSYNEEGSKVVGNLKVKNKDYAEAVQIIMDSPQMEPYLTDAQTMWVTVQANDSLQKQKVEDAVQNVIDVVLKQHHTGTHVEYSTVDEQTRIEAESNGVTASKYTAILELKQYDPRVSVEQYKHHSMHYINTEIEAHHGGAKEKGHSGASAQDDNNIQASPEPQQHEPEDQSQQHQQDKSEQHDQSGSPQQDNNSSHEGGGEDHGGHSEGHKSDRH